MSRGLWISLLRHSHGSPGCQGNSIRSLPGAFNSLLAQIYADPDFIDTYRETLTMIAHPVPSIEESLQMGEEFAGILAPYV